MFFIKIKRQHCRFTYFTLQTKQEQQSCSRSNISWTWDMRNIHIYLPMKQKQMIQAFWVFGELIFRHWHVQLLLKQSFLTFTVVKCQHRFELWNLEVVPTVMSQGKLSSAESAVLPPGPVTHCPTDPVLTTPPTSYVTQCINPLPPLVSSPFARHTATWPANLRVLQTYCRASDTHMHVHAKGDSMTCKKTIKPCMWD